MAENLEGSVRAQPPSSSAMGALAEKYALVRNTTEALASPLAPEDCLLQSMPEASPTKWHLAHTTWFFETMVLRDFVPRFSPYDARFDPLFNSYYETLGPRHPRPRRGMLSRPSLDEVYAYRRWVDARMAGLLSKPREGPELAQLSSIVTLGIEHEQQHQELLLTDIQHALFQNPLGPAYLQSFDAHGPKQAPGLRFLRHPGGMRSLGHEGEGFSFDNERPRHDVRLQPFEIASRLVTNAEYLAFVEDGGYRRPELWLSDGFAEARSEDWTAPLYWQKNGNEVSVFSLAGWQPLDPNAPVAHVSFYEADAYARWFGARLPTEAEWEAVAAELPVDGNFAESGRLLPIVANDDNPAQVFGDVWEWTASPYVPYPGFRPLAGSLGEYNGKFMCNQMVLRGGSCLTPRSHARATYRNFFYPRARWQKAGIRLARCA